MQTFQLLNISEFEFVGYKFTDPSLIQKTKLHKRGKKKRVYYYLPDENHHYHNTVPQLSTKKEKDIYIAEFKIALQNGFLPKKGANKLRKNSFDPKDGRFDIFFKNYFEKYSTKKRNKDKKSSMHQKSISNRIKEYFENIGIFSITEITDKDIETWDNSLSYTLKIKGEGFIKPATRNGWRKTFRAFLNTAQEQDYPIQCNPKIMNIYEHGKGGVIDTTVDARKVIYPIELIEAVEKCSFQIETHLMPDMKKIIRFWREVGLRPGEMFNLSEHNFIFEDGRPKILQIIELKNCPNNTRFDFVPKNGASYRSLLLSDYAISFVESIFKRFKGIKRYGKYADKLMEYPFLFVFWDDVLSEHKRHTSPNSLSQKTESILA